MTLAIASPHGVSSSRSLNQQLLEAAKNGDNDEVCRLVLLEDGEDEERGDVIVDVNTRDKRGYTVLHYCSNRTESRPDDGDTVRLLLERGAIVEARNHEGCTPLHLAAKNGLVDTASVLLETGGAHANSKNVFEWTPLTYCAEHNQAKVACLLLGKGASVHTKNRAGCTPLHYAAMAGHVSIIHLLIGMGADIHARRKVDGKTPLDLAKNEETARILKGSSSSSLSLPVPDVSSLQAALQQQPKQTQQQQARGGSSLQGALEQKQQVHGGGGSSLQTALRQTQQQPQKQSISIAATSSSTNSSTHSSGIPGTNGMDKRLEALVEKQEHLTVSLQDQVNRLEMLLAASTNNTVGSSNAQQQHDDTTITMMDYDDLQQENFRTTVAVPVKTITIQAKSKNRGVKPMAHGSKKKSTSPPQQQMQWHDPKIPSGPYSSTTIASKPQQQQPKKPNDNTSVDSNRHLNRTVLVPIGTNSDGATMASATAGNHHGDSANSPTPRTRTRPSPRRHQLLNDFAMPPRTPPTTHQKTKASRLSYLNKNNSNKNPNSTSGDNECPPHPQSSPTPALKEAIARRSRVKRSGLLERMKIYEKDATGGHQQHNNNNMTGNNDERQIQRRMTNQF